MCVCVCVCVCVFQIYRRGSERSTDLSWEALKKEVTVAVESEVLYPLCVCFYHRENSTGLLMDDFFLVSESKNLLSVSFLFPLCASLQLQSSVTEFEFSQEEYRQLQVEFWSKFYACCLQYQEALSTPLGLTVSQHTNMVCLLKKVKKLLVLNRKTDRKDIS